jgi:serine phosphatase RsbU (regulator of sigma subunit)/Flp pilus assembly protein TadD
MVFLYLLNMKYLSLIIFFSSFVLHSQSLSKIDSLEGALKNNKNENIILELKLQLANAYLDQDNNKAINIAKNIATSFKKINNKYKLGKCYSIIGEANTNLSEYEEAIMSFMVALKLFESEGNEKEINAIKKRLGVVYLNLEKYSLALKYFNETKLYYEKSNESRGLASIYNNIGLVFEKLGKLDSALISHQKSLDIKEKLNDKNGIANSSNNIGNIYFLKNKYKKALMYYKHALLLKQELGEESGIINALHNIGFCYFHIKDYEKAKELAYQAISICNKNNDADGLKNEYFFLAGIFSTTKKFEEAYVYYTKGDSIDDVIFNAENNNQILELETKYQTEKKEKEIEVKTLEISNQDLDLKRKQLTIYAFTIVLILLGVLGFFIYKGYKQKQRAYEIIKRQKQIVEEKNKEITDSIAYAKRIQNALLTPSVTLDTNVGLGQHFVYFKPKDIVSGDFYWSADATSQNGDALFYIACCDCTGHGVPGAFMSILSMGFLSEAIKEKQIFGPGEIFNYTRTRLISSVSKEGQQDGFDGILFCFNLTTQEISYAASNNNPIIIRDNEIIHLKCDKMPVGKGMREDLFTTYKYHKQEKDKLYLYTDGYPDQFGGPKGKKFMYKKLNEFLISISTTSFAEQPHNLNNALMAWQSDLEQVDDILIIGIQL